MSIDTIGDFLTIIRNGLMVSKAFVVIPHSKIKFDIAKILKEEGFITPKDLPFDIYIKSGVCRSYKIEGTLKDACNRLQKEYIEEVLKRVNGNQVQAAKILGIHRNALFNKLKAFGIKK